MLGSTPCILGRGASSSERTIGLGRRRGARGSSRRVLGGGAVAHVGGEVVVLHAPAHDQQAAVLRDAERGRPADARPVAEAEGLVVVAGAAAVFAAYQGGFRGRSGLRTGPFHGALLVFALPRVALPYRAMVSPVVPPPTLSAGDARSGRALA